MNAFMWYIFTQIGVNIVYPVGPIFDKWISNMIFTNQFKVSNCFIFKSKSSRQLFYINPSVEPLIV